MKNCFLLFLLLPLLGISQKFSISAPASWVAPQTIDYKLTIKSDKVEGGYYFMLIDEQNNAIKKENYYHYVYKIISDAGVQNASELSFDFNPVFQKMTFHELKIIRNGKTLNKLRKEKIKVIQREKDLDSHIFDNSYTAYLVMDDVRAGDVVEYSYSVIGDNPIFAGRFFYAFNLYSEYEMLKIYERVVKDKNKNYYIHYYKSDDKPTIVSTANTEELIWEKTNLPGVKLEKNTPNEYRQNQLIEISEYADWNEVKKWAEKIFEPKNYSKAGLQKKAKEITDRYPDKKDQLIAALRFTQDQVRYYGVEIGINAIKPHSPDFTFANRFGDCKDKSVLFCALLKELGFKDCYPVLVNSNRRDETSLFAATPHAFNHCIAGVVLDNKQYFFDPTTSYERGDFEHTYPARYYKGLALNGQYNGLDSLRVTALVYTYMKEEYNIKNIEGEAELVVKTVYHGDEADNQRYNFANGSFETIAEGYLNVYKNIFEEVEKIADLELEDDTIKNIFTMTERYKIACIWDSSGKINKSLIAYFEPLVINDFLNAYPEQVEKRKTPIGIRMPLQYVQDVEVTLPEDWNITDFDANVKNEWLRYQMKVRSKNKRCFTIHYEFETFKKACEPGKAAEFISSIQKIKDEKSYSISYSVNDTKETSSDGFKFHWMMFVIFILFIVLSLVGCLFFFHRKKTPPILFPELEVDTKVQGIGGWLVLPTIGLCIAPFINIYDLLTGGYFDLTTWNSLTNSDGATYSAAWPFVVAFELICFSFLLVFDIFLLVMLFKHDHRFPKWMIIRLSVLLLYGTCMMIGFSIGNTDSGTGRDEGSKIFYKTLFSAAIWIPYFMFSKRVKNTFIK